MVMPYIPQGQRAQFDRLIESVNITGAGKLNYVITRLVDNYIMKMGKRYDSCNIAIGVLECAKQELYRRVVAPYEDDKAEFNGDVYFC
jgi:hypothetical protein